MSGLHWDCQDEAATLAVAERFGHAARSGATVYLYGELGAGKTTFCRGVLRALGYQGAVKSPTYTLVEAYEFLQPPCFHFDLYRLGDPEELEFIGIQDYFLPGHLCLLEWPDKGAGCVPAADISVTIASTGSGRGIDVHAHNVIGDAIIARLRS